jgi:hypothetical protein
LLLQTSCSFSLHCIGAAARLDSSSNAHAAAYTEPSALPACAAHHLLTHQTCSSCKLPASCLCTAAVQQRGLTAAVTRMQRLTPSLLPCLPALHITFSHIKLVALANFLLLVSALQRCSSEA